MKSNEFIEKLNSIFNINRIEDSSEFKIVLKNNSIIVTGVEKVLEIYNEIVNAKKDSLAIYYRDKDDNEVAEVAILRDEVPYSDDDDSGFLIEDYDNEIKYEMMAEVSDHYMVWIFKEILERFEMDKEWERLVRNSLRVRMRLLTRVRKDGSRVLGTETSLLDMMRNLIVCGSLKITKSTDSKVYLKDAIDSFSYTFMCNMNSSIKIYNIEETLRIFRHRQREVNDDFQAPKRKYNSNLIDYYNMALSSEEPFVSFISYYHIIEYFFDAVFREQQINSLRARITAPRFKYNDDDELYSVIKKIISDNKSVRENGSGNEIQSLNYVLEKYIDDIEDFKRRLSEDEQKFYQNNFVSFAKGSKINWDQDRGKIIKNIGNRIYKTRNALIHSKSGKIDETYHPYLHKSDLEREIIIVKVVAECIIENDSKLIDG